MSSKLRLFTARVAGLLVMAALYVSVYGTSVSDDRQPAAAPDTDALLLPDSTDELRDRIEDANLDSPDRWAGLVEQRITQPIVIDLDRDGPAAIRGLGLTRIIMDGPGPALKFVGTHAGTADPKSVQPNVWASQRMPIVDGIEIVGNHPEACGIELTGTMQATLTRLNIRGCLHAVHLTGKNRNVLISDSHLYENSGCGVLLDDVDLHQINITGSHISYNAGGGVVSRKGNVRNLHITGCDIESNVSSERPLLANILIDCRDSRYGTAEVAITGCTIQHNSPAIDGANVRIIGRSNATDTQPVVREGNVTITGNVLSDVQTNVHLKDCRGVTLQGNTFWMGYQYNLLVEDCTNVVIGPNNLDRNPRYDYGNATTSHNAVAFQNCADCTISGLHVTQVREAPAGITFTNCRWCNISDLTVLDCPGPALSMVDCEHCRVAGLLTRVLPGDMEKSPVATRNCVDVRIIDDGLRAAGPKVVPVSQ
jgi:hypothetical protein